jgi:predicted small secreted protein
MSALESSKNYRSFWPKIYRPNVSRYPELSKVFGGAANLMKAEKKWLWNAMKYNDKCAGIVEKIECEAAKEDRISELHHPYFKSKSVKTCAYKAKSCKSRDVDYSKLSLQFLRWMLFELDRDSFNEYVKQFPHQVTEERYGFNVEDGRRYIPVDAVEELQATVVPSSIEEIMLERISPIGASDMPKKATPVYLSDDDKKLRLYQAQLRKCKSMLQNAKTKLGATNAKNKDLVETFTQTQRLVTNLRVANSKLVTELEDVSALKMTQKDSRNSLSKLRFAKKDIIDEVFELKNLVKSLTSELDESMEEVKTLKAQMKTLDNEYKEMLQKFNECEADLSETKTYYRGRVDADQQKQIQLQLELDANEEEMLAILEKMKMTLQDHVGRKQITSQNRIHATNIANKILQTEAQITDEKLSQSEKLKRLYETYEFIFDAKTGEILKL